MERIDFPLWENAKKSKLKDVIFFSVVGFLLALMITFIVLNTFVFINIEVSGESMMHTLQSGDVLVANKNKKPQVGDVVVISGVKDYLIIKRVIAIGDDDGTEVMITNGAVFVDGEKLVEDYDFASIIDTWYSAYWQLEKDEIFYLGDNRQNSQDARGNGPCKMENVIGVVDDWAIRNRGLIKAIYFIPMQLAKLFGSGCGGNAK